MNSVRTCIGSQRDKGPSNYYDGRCLRGKTRRGAPAKIVWRSGAPLSRCVRDGKHSRMMQLVLPWACQNFSARG